MVGSLADAFGPAAFLFLRPMRVVGCGGGSYLGLSFYTEVRSQICMEERRSLPSCPYHPFHPGRRPSSTGSDPKYSQYRTLSEDEHITGPTIMKSSSEEGTHLLRLGSRLRGVRDYVVEKLRS